jgi:serine/threonine-protein kinase
VALAGGLPVPLVEVGARPNGGWWGDDGHIVLSRSSTSGIYRVSQDGGPLEELTRPNLRQDERSHRWPQLLPGGQALLFTIVREGGSFE